MPPASSARPRRRRRSRPISKSNLRRNLRPTCPKGQYPPCTKGQFPALRRRTIIVRVFPGSGTEAPTRGAATRSRNTRAAPMPDREQGAIVVVEDDEGMRSAAQRVLNAAGFRAEAFASAESLLESGAADGAACMVLDIHLPGLSGFELCHEFVRTGTAYPPVIFITGHDD